VPKSTIGVKDEPIIRVTSSVWLALAFQDTVNPCVIRWDATVPMALEALGGGNAPLTVEREPPNAKPDAVQPGDGEPSISGPVVTNVQLQPDGPVIVGAGMAAEVLRP